MTGPITDARVKLAADIRTVFPQLPVFTVPPTQVVTPSATVILDSCEQTTGGLWVQDFEIQLLGPAGDNLAAVNALESMLMPLAVALSTIYAQPISWRKPSTLSNVGQVYLTTSFTVSVEIAP